MEELQVQDYESVGRVVERARRRAMSIWDRLTSEEKQWVLEDGCTEEDANNDIEDTINFLHKRWQDGYGHEVEAGGMQMSSASLLSGQNLAHQ